MNSRGLSPGASRALVALLVVLQLAAAITSIRKAPQTIFRGRPARTITPQVESAVRTIRAWIPDIEPLLYLGDTDDAWLPRVWERALGPEPVAIVMSAQRRASNVAELRRRLGIRWALSTGLPPLDPGFDWHVRLAFDRRSGREFWFGRLAK